MRTAIVTAWALSLTACATPVAEQVPTPSSGKVCDAEAVQNYVGRPANSENAAAILSTSGARAFRWGPPNSAWTMDHRPDRVSVRYDEAMTITRITCG